MFAAALAFSTSGSVARAEDKQADGWFLLKHGAMGGGVGVCLEGACSGAPTATIRQSWLLGGYRSQSRGGAQTELGAELLLRHALAGLDAWRYGAALHLERDGFGLRDVVVSYRAGLGIDSGTLRAAAGSDHDRAELLTLSCAARLRWPVDRAARVDAFMLAGFDYSRALNGPLLQATSAGLPAWISEFGFRW
ncbi:hypothetical protein [Sorangium sp. So ce381]|uniref:hypothetical protein n=1 Tax=Sorangium sp. So ce381 TaxID=3133307 RepID=UPI003F5BE853